MASASACGVQLEQIDNKRQVTRLGVESVGQSLIQVPGFFMNAPYKQGGVISLNQRPPLVKDRWSSSGLSPECSREPRQKRDVHSFKDRQLQLSLVIKKKLSCIRMIPTVSRTSGICIQGLGFKSGNPMLFCRFLPLAWSLRSILLRRVEGRISFGGQFS